MTSERLPLQLVFRGDDPFEARLHAALKALPRGYSEQIVVGALRAIFETNMSADHMRSRMEDAVTSPSLPMPRSDD